MVLNGMIVNDKERKKKEISRSILHWGKQVIYITPAPTLIEALNRSGVTGGAT